MRPPIIEPFSPNDGRVGDPGRRTPDHVAHRRHKVVQNKTAQFFNIRRRVLSLQMVLVRMMQGRVRVLVSVLVANPAPPLSMPVRFDQATLPFVKLPPGLPMP